MRLLRRESWYDRVSGPGGLSEAEFEKIFENAAPEIFPRHILTEFRVPVSSPDGTRRPDYALIEENCQRWWILEVEMLHHSLFGHVMPQVITFSEGTYTVAMADRLAEGTGLPLRRLAAMIRGAPPGVIVVTDGVSDEWSRNFGPYGIRMCPIEVYRSQRNDHVLRCSPPEIGGPPNLVTRCRRDDQLPRLLSVDAPAALEGLPSAPLEVVCRGTLATFDVVESADKVWLNPSKGDALDPRVHLWDLIMTGNGRLEFKPASKGRKRAS